MDVVNKAIPHTPKVSEESLKQIPGGIKDFFTADNWPYWVGAIVVVLLITLLWFLIVKRRRSKKTPEPVALPQPEPKKEELPRSTLLNVWKGFLKNLPYKLRKAVGRYDRYVVMGEPGAGKSLLIENHTDWEGQSLQFHPSHTENPLLQIYLGSGVAVQEISASLLNDTSESARAALANLWKRSFKGRTPRAVIVINVAALQSGSADSLKRQAHYIRGKLNVLSESCRRSVEVCVALTHMDQIDGFKQFLDFLSEKEIPLNIRFFSSAEDDAKESADEGISLSAKLGVTTHLDRMETCLEPYETLLSQALTTQSADRFLEIISFMRRAPELFSRLSSFLDLLKKQSDLSVSPEIVQLCLSGPVDGVGVATSPFSPHFEKLKPKKFNPVSGHRLAASILLAIGVAYLLSGFALQHRYLSNIYQQVKQIKDTPPDIKHDTDFLGSIRWAKSYRIRMFPNYFPDETKNCRNVMLNYFRNEILIPLYHKFANSSDNIKQLMYVVGLLYASNQNQLGGLVMANLSEWSKELELPKKFIHNYVLLNQNTWKGASLLEKVDLKLPKINSQHFLEPWLVFFLEVSEAVKMPYIDANQLAQLQQKADNLLQQFVKETAYATLIEVQRALAKDVPMLGMSPMMPLSKGYPVLYRILKEESSRNPLALIRKYDITYPSVENLTLDYFLNNLEVMIHIPDEVKEQGKLEMPFEKYSITTQQWVDLICRSRIILFMKAFMAYNEFQSGLIFFPNNGVFTQLTMNPGNDGSLFFTGKGKVDGRFTAGSFEQYVKPSLIKLPGVMEKLPVRPENINAFSNFVYREIEIYAGRYVSEYQEYYMQFGIEANSVSSLKYVLNRMQQKSSQFQNFLLTVKENTVFKPEASTPKAIEKDNKGAQKEEGASKPEESPYVQPFTQAMETFGFINRVMQGEKGQADELDKYMGIIHQMLGDISNEKPAPSEKKTEKPLMPILSPLGKISLSIFLNEEGSYLNLVKKWISSMNIPSEYQKPFLQPVYLTYQLGITEVESAVNAIWNELKEDYINRFITQFPFKRDAKDDVSPDWLNRNLAPGGEFWQKAEGYLLPVCRKDDQGWSNLPPSVDVFHLPDGMLDRLNQLENMKKRMWDQKGKPIAVSLFVKPTPLPPLSVYGSKMPVAVLSYLRSGKLSVFGFNQQPEWQPFSVEWWQDQEASVGVSFVARAENASDGYGSVTGPISGWSFYHLLKKGDEVARNVFRWEVTDASHSADRAQVEFVFKNDPWALFTIKKPSGSSKIKVEPLTIR